MVITEIKHFGAFRRNVIGNLLYQFENHRIVMLNYGFPYTSRTTHLHRIDDAVVKPATAKLIDTDTHRRWPYMSDFMGTAPRMPFRSLLSRYTYRLDISGD